MTTETKVRYKERSVMQNEIDRRTMERLEEVCRERGIALRFSKRSHVMYMPNLKMVVLGKAAKETDIQELIKLIIT